MVASPCSLLRTTVYLHHTVSHDVTDVLFDFFLKTYLQTDQPTYISRSIYALLLHRSIKSELKISQELKDHQENKIFKMETSMNKADSALEEQTISKDVNKCDYED